jgi:hypothetical protein
MTTTDTTIPPEKYEALRRSGQLPAAELPEVSRCDSFGHVASLSWVDAYADRAHAERVEARLLALVGTVCLECIRWRAKAAESAAWIEANSVRSEIMGRLEKQQAAARVADERAREQARVAPPLPPASRQAPGGSRLGRALATAVERPFDFSGI